MAACFLLACGGQIDREQRLQRIQSDLTAEEEAAAGVAPTSGHSCEELLARFQSTLLAEVGPRAEAARSNPYFGNPLFGGSVAVGRSSSLSSSAEPASRARPPFSSTTSLIPGVEPADLVKAEGDRIFLVHDTSLLVLDATDGGSLELSGSVALGDGSPVELLVHEGRVLVFSNVYEGLPGVPPANPYGYPRSFTKLTVVDATGAEPAISHQSYFEGSSYSPGIAGGVARAYIQQTARASLDYPPVNYVDIFGKPRSQEDIDRQIELWVELTTESIQASAIEDYLPLRFERVGEVLQGVPVSCAGLLLPPDGQAIVGASSLVTVDLAAPAASPTSLQLFGYAQGVLFEENGAVLVQQAYSGPNEVVPQVRSILHVFHFDGVDVSYAGSGTLPGYLASSVGLDQASGVLSAVVSRDVYGPSGLGTDPEYQRSVVQVQTLKLEQGKLAPLGLSPELPGNYLVAARIDGDRAYVTTANERNVLAVVDLEDPAAPAIFGTLSLEGYSNSLLPFGDEQLLTLTELSDPVTYVSRLALQLLDVQDPSAPTLATELSLGQNVYSEASYDARAISVHPEGTFLALPLQSYELNRSSLEVVQFSEADGLTRLGGVTHELAELSLLECLAYIGYPSDEASLEDLESNPELRESLLRDCNAYRVASARRGLFRGDEVFAISTARVTAHALDALSEPPLGSVELPLPALSPIGPFRAPLPVIDVVPASESSPTSEE